MPETLLNQIQNQKRKRSLAKLKSHRQSDISFYSAYPEFYGHLTENETIFLAILRINLYAGCKLYLLEEYIEALEYLLDDIRLDAFYKIQPNLWVSHFVEVTLFAAAIQWSHKCLGLLRLSSATECLQEKLFSFFERMLAKNPSLNIGDIPPVFYAAKPCRLIERPDISSIRYASEVNFSLCLVKRLVEKGCHTHIRVENKNFKYKSLLAWACSNGDARTVRFLWNSMDHQTLVDSIEEAIAVTCEEINVYQAAERKINCLEIFEILLAGKVAYPHSSLSGILYGFISMFQSISTAAVEDKLYSLIVLLMGLPINNNDLPSFINLSHFILMHRVEFPQKGLKKIELMDALQKNLFVHPELFAQSGELLNAFLVNHHLHSLYLDVIKENPLLLEKFFAKKICLHENDEDQLFQSYRERVSSRFLNFIEDYQRKDVNSIVPFFMRYAEDIQRYFSKQRIVSIEPLQMVSDMRKFLSLFSDVELIKLLNAAIENPCIAKQLSSLLGALHELEVYDNGLGLDNWSVFSAELVHRMPEPKPSANDESSRVNSINVSNKSALSLSDLKKQGWDFLRFQGRTILLQKAEQAILAVKVQKKSEGIKELEREFQSTIYFSSHADAFKLLSQFPEPISVSEISDLSAWLEEIKNSGVETQDFAAMINLENAKAYLYQLSKECADYFTYLHDTSLSYEKFCQASTTTISDLSRLLGRGFIFSQLADIFHNNEEKSHRQDQGRYLVLANLLLGQSFGSGRLTGWKEAVNYPNVRGSGLADFGDWSTQKNYLASDGPFSKINRYQNKLVNYVLCNVLAEYQYVLFLIAGRRGHNLQQQGKRENKSSEDIFAIWLQLAKQVISNCVMMITTLTTYSELHARNFLSCLIDESRLAKQMQFWMTDDYIPHVKNNMIPASIYPENTKLSVNLEKFRKNTFHLELGCSIDGVHQDLGPVNGQEPLKEANKLFYWMVNIISVAYHMHALTRRNLISILKEKNKPLPVERYEQAFSHLSLRHYHGAMFAVTKNKKHHKECAAATIQHAWKNHRYI